MWSGWLPRFWLAIPRQRLRTWRIGVVLSVAATAIFLLFFLLLLFGSSRSFLVEAETDGLRLEFVEDGNLWRLPDAILCLPLDVPAAILDPDCGLAAAADGPPRERLLDWSAGARVDATLERDGGLRVTVVDSGTAGPLQGASFVLSRTAWKSAGALTFRAHATIGQDMRTGARHYLHGGRWEAREVGWVTSLLRSVTEVVKVGDLSTGAVVTVTIGDGPALVYGHLTPGSGGGHLEEDAAIDVTLISQLGNTALSTRHFGLSNPVVIRPDWIDVAVSSPLLLAMAALFSVLASVGQLLMFGLGRSKGAPGGSVR